MFSDWKRHGRVDDNTSRRDCVNVVNCCHYHTNMLPGKSNPIGYWDTLHGFDSFHGCNLEAKKVKANFESLSILSNVNLIDWLNKHFVVGHDEAGLNPSSYSDARTGSWLEHIRRRHAERFLDQPRWRPQLINGLYKRRSLMPGHLSLRGLGQIFPG